MSETPIPFPRKNADNPDKEQRQKLQRLVRITGNKANGYCCKPNPFIYSRQIP